LANSIRPFQHLELDLPLPQLLRQLNEMPQGARQPIQALHDEHIPRLEIGPAGEKAGAIRADPRHLILVEMTRFHAGCPQGVELEVETLVFG
jgi:hypothetical protein